MVKVLRGLLWFGLIVLTILLGDESLPWIPQTWSVLLVVLLLVEVPIWIGVLRRLEERGEDQRLEEEVTLQGNRKLAEVQVARDAQAERERLGLLLDSLQSLVDVHTAELASRREELVKYGRYGIPDRTDWIAEKEMFAEEVVAAEYPESTTMLTRAQVLNLIDLVLDGRPPEVALLVSTGTASSQTQPSTQPQVADFLKSQRAEDLPSHQSDDRRPIQSDDRRARNTDQLSTISLVLAIPGVFLPGLVFFQVSALVVGIIALSRRKPLRQTRRWQAWVGAGLGLIYTVYFIARFTQGYFGAY